MREQLGDPEVEVDPEAEGVYDFVCGAVRQASALGYLSSNIPKKIKRSVEIWISEKQRLSMSRSTDAESEQLLGLVRRAALSREEQYYSLRKVEDMGHLATTWALQE